MLLDGLLLGGGGLGGRMQEASGESGSFSGIPHKGTPLPRHHPGMMWQKVPCGSSGKEKVPLDAATMPRLGTQHTPVTMLVVGPLQWPWISRAHSHEEV